MTQLCEVPGIGPWTAQYVAMRALGEPDALPTRDLGLVRALALEDPHELEERSQAWRPWRAYAAMYLWNTASVPEDEVSHSLPKPTVWLGETDIPSTSQSPR